MSEDKMKLKKLVLEKRKEGKLVYLGLECPVSIPIKDFIKQPADGILYDLNRLEETALTFMDDPKWVNDFAVALTIRALYKKAEKLEVENKILFNFIGQHVNDKDGRLTKLHDSLVALGEQDAITNRTQG